MKLWIIRHKGKPTLGNYLSWSYEIDCSGKTIHAGRCFFRKKDAALFISNLRESIQEGLTIVSVEAT